MSFSSSDMESLDNVTDIPGDGDDSSYFSKTSSFQRINKKINVNGIEREEAESFK